MYQTRRQQLLNFGDTSFRRHDYAVVLPYCLKTLSHLKVDDKEIRWAKNEAIQAEYYKLLLDNTDFFSESSDRSRLSQRGRTNTNIMVKLGLATPSRIVSPVAKDWLNPDSGIKQPDQIENLIGLKTDNLLYLRQLLKLRLYDNRKAKYVYPFRLIIKTMSVIDRMPKDIFSLFFFAITPDLSIDSINRITALAATYDNRKLDEQEADRIKTELRKIAPEPLAKTKEDFNKLLESGDFSSPTLDSCPPDFKDLFADTFFNKKSSKAVSDYYLFLHHLFCFNRDRNPQTLKCLKDITKKDSVRSAFAAGSRLFKTEQRHAGVQQFLETNKDSIYLCDPPDCYSIYLQFIASKKEQLQSEYLDMSCRIMLLSGILTNINGQISLRYSALWKRLFEHHDIPLNGQGSYKEYEQDENSAFYRDITAIEILGYSQSQCEDFLRDYAADSGVGTLAELQQQFHNQQSEQFKDLIQSEFPKNKVVEILAKIDLHNSRDKSKAEEADKDVQRLVTDSADIPTIFEYILNIAWFYLSNMKTDPLRSMNLTCDGNMRPLSHASGGAGDIEVLQNETTLVLLEASLMSGNTQKRGELEPVIRHSTNLTIDNPGQAVRTIFCANAVDNDVANIYRAASNIELYHSSKKEAEPTHGVIIFAITIQELITFLSDERLNADTILQRIGEFSEEDRESGNWEWGDWRKSRVKSLLESETHP